MENLFRSLPSATMFLDSSYRVSLCSDKLRAFLQSLGIQIAARKSTWFDIRTHLEGMGILRSHHSIPGLALIDTFEFKAHGDVWIKVDCSPVEQSGYLLEWDLEHGQKQHHKAFARLTRTSSEDLHFFDEVACSLIEGLGYRWGWISRYRQGEDYFEIIGSSDRALHVPCMYLDPASPCSAILHGEVPWNTLTRDLAARMPHVPFYTEMGIESYCGTAYYDANQALAGHVFAFDDKPDLQTEMLGTFLQGITETVSRALSYNNLLVRLESAEKNARTDAMTGLLNRAAFDEDLAKLKIRFSNATEEDVLLIYMDLNGLKKINDTHGHEHGDKLLQTFARHAKESMRGDDAVYRLGGDEFAILLPSPPDTIRETIYERIAWMEESTRQSGFPESGVSVGLSRLSETRGCTVKLVKEADARMYTHKQSTRSART